MARNKKVLALALLPLPLVLAVSGCSQQLEGFTLFDLLGRTGSALKGPANLPPSNYEGEYWVDRKGCIFIRTGEAEWLPQVDNDRKPICDASQAGEVIAEPEPRAPTTPSVSIDPETGLRTEILAPVNIRQSYVEVGTFDDYVAGVAAWQELAGLGFPMLGGETLPEPGRPVKIVLGPFMVKSALDDALATAIERGHDDAFSY